MRYLYWFLVATLFSLNTYAVGNNTELEVSDNNTIEGKVAALQSKWRIANNQNKELHAKILELEEKIREFNGKLQDLEHIESRLTTKIQNLTVDTNLRFESLDKKASPNQAQDKTNLEKTIVAPAMVKYLNMIEKKNYKGAIQGLEQYISVNHNSSTLGEAYYWLGYAYMSNQEYTKAIKMFVNSYNGYPKGSKAEYSLLNMAVSLYRVKEYNKSCALLSKLIATSQNKQILQLAKFEHKDFQCKALETKSTNKAHAIAKPSKIKKN